MHKVILSNNLPVLKRMKDAVVDLIYIDPPFNTGKVQRRLQSKMSFPDSYENFLCFLEPRLQEMHRILKTNGSLFFHIDYREVHYCKVLLDSIFGEKSFINEIIWVFDYGARSKTRWSAKHNNILWYAKDPDNYTFNYTEIERIPYMAPGLVGEEKAARGKTLTDSWWHTIVPTNGKEKTGYPTQKPRGIIDRIVKVHSNQGDLVADFFAGSGTVGESCIMLNRKFLLVDSNVEAVNVMKARFSNQPVEFIGNIEEPANASAS